MISKSYLTYLVYKINGAIIDVHKNLGPGLLESTYKKCLIYELNQRNIKFQSELIVPIKYKGLELDANLRCDLLIEGMLAVELKAVEYILPIHEAQILTYMKLLKVPKGLIINFNVTHIYSEGQKTYVNEIYRNLSE